MEWHYHKISLYSPDKWPIYELTEHHYIIKYSIIKREFNSKIKKEVVILNKKDFECISKVYNNNRYKSEFIEEIEELFNKYCRQTAKERKNLENKLVRSMNKQELKEYQYLIEEYTVKKDNNF